MGFVSALQGFAVIAIVIAVGYIARIFIGDSHTQAVLNRISFFVSTPCLMFALMAREKLEVIFHPTILVAFGSALAVGIIFIILNAAFFKLSSAELTIGSLNCMYLNSNNIGLPVATYIVGNPALVAPILVMQQAVFTPVALTLLDIHTSGKVSLKRIATQPLRQPILLGSLGGILVSVISWKTGVFIVPQWIMAPLEMIGNSAVPLILMAFGMSLYGTKPLQKGANIPAIASVTVLKNLVMPLVAYTVATAAGFDAMTVYGCVILAALPTGQNVYNYAARYDVGLNFARDGILFSTLFAPVIIILIAAFLPR